MNIETFFIKTKQQKEQFDFASKNKTSKQNTSKNKKEKLSLQKDNYYNYIKTNKEKTNSDAILKTDKPFLNKAVLAIFVCMLFLCVFGCIMVYSASAYSLQQKNASTSFFLIKQIIGVALGLCCFVFFCFFNHRKFIKLKWVILIVACVCLCLVFVPVIGIENYGAKRWVGVGGLTFQPSELAKFALVLFVACHYSKHYKEAKKLKTLLPVVAVGGILCLLVIVEPNMSITMCLGLCLLLMVFLCGATAKTFMVIIVPALCLVFVLIFMEPYRIARLMAFLDPWSSPKGEGFQLIQSLYSLGNGSLFGVGLFSSRQSMLYLPFAESDFIFAIICEELGLFGALFVLIVFAVLIYSLIMIAKNCIDRFSAYLVLGIACVIFVQVALNVAVVTGSIPPTGLPLPFISAGTTSLMVFMSMLGICANVAVQNKMEEKSVLVNKN